MLDLTLAVLHHLIVFALVGVVLMELVSVRSGMDIRAVQRVAAMDLGYAMLAGLVLLVGFTRAVLAAKGWEYYSANPFFWAKIGTFMIIGLLSIAPTVSYLRWRKAGTAPTDQAVATVRLFLLAEVVLFAPLLAFAATMARGTGSQRAASG